VEKKEEWTQKFLQSSKDRPDSSKYAHREIREALNATSMHKCFYCERKLKGIPSEVDHYVEVAEQPEKAFEWENLYLACSDCNRKLSNRSIPNGETLNPCEHPDEEIMQHLTFEDEMILPLNGSVRGLQTIKKYKLDSQQLDYLRLKQRQYFTQLLLRIKDNQIRENRKHLTPAELAALHRFGEVDHPFSLMFKVLLAKNPLMQSPQQ
jgi:hypothetical protein